MNSTTTNEEQRTTPVTRTHEKGHRWFAALFDKMMRAEERGLLGEMRRQLLGDLTGEVLEIGAGTGANFEHYRPNVRVIALEPDPFMLKRAEEKLATARRSNITLRQAPAERLPVDDASFDAVVSTLVLCTVEDMARSLAEVRRVLRPGGQLRFIEHVRAAGFGGRAQDFISPIWGWFGAGCHPNRRTESAIRSAGFEIASLERSRLKPLMLPVITGVARVRQDG